jgi:signal transduction histidine kinase
MLEAERNHPIHARWKDLIAGRKDAYRFEHAFAHKEGHTVWGRLAVSLVRSVYGRPQYILATIEDISEQKQVSSELNELRRRLMQGRELERFRLAQELHEGALQDLYSVAYQLQALISRLVLENNQQNQVGQIQQSFNNIVKKLRNFCRELRPPTLVPFGLEKAIRSHAETFQEQNQDIRIDLDLNSRGITLPQPVRLALFRIYQQVMLNVSQHSGATVVQVKYLVDDDKVFLEVKDNGQGFQAPERWIEFARQGHLGLVSSMERVEALGGTLIVDTQAGKGVTIQVQLSYSSLLPS